MQNKSVQASVLAGAVLITSNTFAHDSFVTSKAFDHAPIGVMGDHYHKQGDFMFSYRYMTMDMEGNRDGSDRISTQEIATSVPNRLAGMPGQPPTLRVVPTSMTMEMHMLGVMYGLSDDVTLMLMTNYTEKDMDHTTFAGPVGGSVLGTFTTRSSGIGDTKLSALWKLHDSGKHKVHANIGISFPTGSTTESDQVLTPMGTTPNLRLPYPMQLGSGTYDLLPGITYVGHTSKWNWGAQLMSTIRTGDNDEGYTFGDQYQITSWGSYLLKDGLSTSVRLSYLDVDNIDGEDALVRAPVQTADPNNYGRKRLDVGLGVNWLHPSGLRLAVEATAPVYQDLDGPQLETDWGLTFGLQKAF